MGAYRISRNLEASLIEYIRTELASAWSNVSTEKTFSKIYDISLPSVCVRLGTTDHEPVELGSSATYRTPQIFVDIFGSDDGNRLDLKDFLFSKLKGGCTYYEYEITNGSISNKVASGRIKVTDIEDTPIQFDNDRGELDKHDRYRHLLTLTVSLGKVEN